MTLIVITTLIAYFISHSPLLLSEFSHSFIDFITILLSILLIGKISGISGNKNFIYTYGLHRLEIFFAILNIVTIIVLSLFIVYSSIISLLLGIHENPILLIIISTIAGILTYVANKFTREDNIGKKGISLHLFSDLISYILGIFAGFIILLYKLYFIDPATAIAIVAINLIITRPILREAYVILMEGSPVNTQDIKSVLESEKINVHHLHVWSVCSHIKAATLHVKVSPNTTIKETDEIRRKISNILKEKYNITHLTVQFESENYD